MNDEDRLALRFERERPRLRAVAYQMLGSLGEADDALHEVWLRLERSGAVAAGERAGSLTTLVARVALQMLHARNCRREQLRKAHLPDPVLGPAAERDPERELLLAGAAGLAGLAELEVLSPEQRLAFVLHDTFAVPFEAIAAILERSPEATRQMASRSRRHLRQAAPVPDVGLADQCALADAFIAATRSADLAALIAILDPHVLLRLDGGPGGVSRYERGVPGVARQALMWSRSELTMRRTLINRAAGFVLLRDGKPVAVGALVVQDGRIVELDILADPERLGRLEYGLVEKVMHSAA